MLSLLTILCILGVTYFILKSGVGKATHEGAPPDPKPGEKTGITYVQKKPPLESTYAYVGLIALVILELYFNITFAAGVIQGFDQRITALAFAMVFVVWGLILALYRREFLPDVLMVKSRREKVIPEREFDELGPT